MYNFCRQEMCIDLVTNIGGRQCSVCLLYYYIMIYGSHMAMTLVVVTAVVNILNIPSDLLFSF